MLRTMFRTALLATLALGLGACAHWPHEADHPQQTSAKDCTPTGSKISRQGCAISVPAAAASGEELDRAKQQSGSATAPKAPGQ
jgi:hypothetical protein